MTLQQFINFDQYVRCFTFGKMDITPVRYDVHERKYLVEHEYLSSDLGARIVKDAQTLNTALGYEMNTIEFAVQDGIPYAIDFLNPAPDFERDRITPHYFDLVIDKMSALVIDRALNGRVQQSWPRWAQMVGLSEARRPRYEVGSGRVGATDVTAIRSTAWHALVRESTDANLCASLATRMRERHLTFGGRLLCPFLRPFFLDPADEGRIKRAAETLWRLGERLAEAAATDDALMAELGLSEAEMALARINPGYGVASTAARADAFLLPDSLQFAEYNAESPAGPGYSQRLAELFDGEPLMDRFREQFDVRFYTPIPELLDALLESYQDWGGTANLPRIAIVDWREVPTWSEFELLRGAFSDAGVPTEICDPRDLVFDGRRLTANGTGRSTWSTGACSSTTSSRGPTSAARSSTPTGTAPSAWPTACAARFRTRRRSSPS